MKAVYLLFIFTAFIFSDILTVTNNAAEDDQIDHNILGILDMVMGEKRLRHQIDTFFNQMKKDHAKLKQDISSKVLALESQTQQLQKTADRVLRMNNDQKSVLERILARYNSSHGKETTMLEQLSKGII